MSYDLQRLKIRIHHLQVMLLKYRDGDVSEENFLNELDAELSSLSRHLEQEVETE